MAFGLILLILYGVNVLQRWLENSATCSSSLVTHVLLMFLIARIGFIGFLILLVDFHRVVCILVRRECLYEF